MKSAAIVVLALMLAVGALASRATSTTYTPTGALIASTSFICGVTGSVTTCDVYYTPLSTGPVMWTITGKAGTATSYEPDCYDVYFLNVARSAVRIARSQPCLTHLDISVRADEYAP